MRHDPVFFHGFFLQNTSMKNRPTILVIAGHDPTGGAGIQADIETINELGGHACSLITALTVQNSDNLFSFEPVSADLFRRQFQTLIKDFSIKAVKIGMIGSPELAETLADLLENLTEIPLVLDPVLAAGGGASVSSQSFIEILKTKLLSRVTLITPNIPEARQLTGKETPDQCADSLMQMGCKNVLITGTHDDREDVVHQLYSASGKISLDGPRLPGVYHGSGCTLASAASFYIASGHSLTNSVKLAQEFTFESLSHAEQPGHGQYFPVRNRKSWS